MEVNVWFLVAFVLAWVAAPVTQLIFLVAPTFHRQLGMTEDRALEPEFRSFFLDEQAIAFADMTHFLSGAAFIWLALLGKPSALIFGLYSCACYVYIAPLAISRWFLFGANRLSPISSKQLPIYIGYMAFFLGFGLFGLFYLWGLTQP